MATGDIYRIFVAYQDSEGGKERYVVEVGREGIETVVLDSITSQYHKKSRFIKAQYYPIQEWWQAGLQKPSYVDIKSSRRYRFEEVIKYGRFTGQLTLHDVQGLAAFIRSYKTRLQQL